MPPHIKHRPRHHHPGPPHHGPHHHGPRHHDGRRHGLHHCLEPDLGVLREVARRKRDASAGTLITLAADLALDAEVSSYLQRIKSEYGDIAAGRALDLADLHFSAKAELRLQELLDQKGDRAGLIFPLPPHVHEPFVERGGATILIPDGHHLPHHLEDEDIRVVDGTRASRKAVQSGEFAILVFEIYRGEGRALIDAEVGEVVAGVTAATELWVQLRPHRHPEDVELDVSASLHFV